MVNPSFEMLRQVKLKEHEYWPTRQFPYIGHKDGRLVEITSNPSHRLYNDRFEY